MSAWPALPYERWRDTHATLHLWLQHGVLLEFLQSTYDAATGPAGWEVTP